MTLVPLVIMPFSVARYCLCHVTPEVSDCKNVTMDWSPPDGNFESIFRFSAQFSISNLEMANGQMAQFVGAPQVREGICVLSAFTRNGVPLRT